MNQSLEPVVVLAHADSPDKVELLKRCVGILKDKGYPVIISSHIPVDGDLVQSVDCTTVDFDNPVIYRDEFEQYNNSIPGFFYNSPGQFSLVYAYEFNHGFAALRLIQNGLALAQAKGARAVHFVNYDYLLEHGDILARHSEMLNHFDVVSYGWDESAVSMNSGLFSVRPTEFAKVILKTQSKADYLRFPGKTILEDFLHHACTAEGLRIKLRSNSLLAGQAVNLVLRAPYKEDRLAWIFLAKERTTGELLLFLESRESEGVFEIETLSKRHLIENRLSLVKVTAEMLQGGIKVLPPLSDNLFEFNQASQLADISVFNPAATVELSSFSTGFTTKISYHEGPTVEILNGGDFDYQVEFIDDSCGCRIYRPVLRNNHWAKCSQNYYTPWKINVTCVQTGEVFESVMDLSGKMVLAEPQAEDIAEAEIAPWCEHLKRFHLAKGCEIFVKGISSPETIKNYPELHFIEQEERVPDLYAKYQLRPFSEAEWPSRLT